MPEDICYNCNIDITLSEMVKIYQAQSKMINKGEKRNRVRKKERIWSSIKL